MVRSGVRRKGAALLAGTVAALTIVFAARAHAEPRAEQRFGGVVPPGYRVERRVDAGLAAAGAVTFAVSYGLVTIADARERPVLWIPAAGPFLAAASVRGRHELPNELTQTLFVTMGLVEVVGLTMLAFGLVGRRYLVPEERVEGARWPRLTPHFGPTSLGLSFATF